MSAGVLGGPRPDTGHPAVGLELSLLSVYVRYRPVVVAAIVTPLVVQRVRPSLGGQVTTDHRLIRHTALFRSKPPLTSLG
jgi:hypothetical protein